MFTLDDKNVEAVQEAFVRMYEKGIIYWATRLVNWCCGLNTALSDIEVDKEELKEPKKLKVPVPNDPKAKFREYDFGYFTNFVYKIKGSDWTIEVATTRLETMLGDVAVAVHPDDPRYKDLVGKELIHPFLPERHLTIITDAELVDMNLGTGAVKITPAHDPNDFKCGQRHNLPQINIFNDNGIINSNGGKYSGMFRFDAWIEMEKEMRELGLFVSKTPKEMVIGRCLKTGDIIEPIIKP